MTFADYWNKIELVFVPVWSSSWHYESRKRAKKLMNEVKSDKTAMKLVLNGTVSNTFFKFRNKKQWPSAASNCSFALGSWKCDSRAFECIKPLLFAAPPCLRRFKRLFFLSFTLSAFCETKEKMQNDYFQKWGWEFHLIERSNEKQ